jgi:Domain of unknown function (DUF4157)
LSGLELAGHDFVPTLPPRASEGAEGNATLPPVSRKAAERVRADGILRRELARPPLTQPRLSAGPAGGCLQGPVENLREPSDDTVRSAAAEGVHTPALALPHLERIQTSFGRHPISHVKAHVGSEAAQASRAMNARAFASGDHVVFGGTPDLRTAAHEAAHVLQQQAGVQLAGRIGREGDAYERHADAVANAVVAGRTAEGLLEPFAVPVAAPYSPGGALPAIQRDYSVDSDVLQNTRITYITQGGSGNQGVLNHVAQQGLINDYRSLHDAIISRWHETNDFVAGGAGIEIRTQAYRYFVALEMVGQISNFRVYHADVGDNYKNENLKKTQKRFDDKKDDDGNDKGGKKKLSDKDIASMSAEQLAEHFDF